MTRLRPLLLTLVVALPALAAEPPAPAALFFQYGRSDAWVSYAEARAYIDAAKEPKLFKFYEGAHELSEAARRDRAQWLRAHLGFGLVDDVEPSREAMRQTALFFEQYLTP